MIRYTVQVLVKNMMLLAWPALILLFVLLTLIFGDVEVANNTSFSIRYGSLPPIPGSTLATQIISIIGLLALIALPTHLVKNYESERAALLFSKPVSRRELFLSDMAGVFLLLIAYSLFTMLLLGLFIGFSAGIIPLNLLFYLLSFPLVLITYYAAISLMVTLTESYMATVFVTFFLPGVSVFLFSKDLLLHAGVTSEVVFKVAEVLNYVIPSFGAANQLGINFLKAGNSLSALAEAFDFSLLLNVIVSCIPFFLLSYYLLLKKEF